MKKILLLPTLFSLIFSFGCSEVIKSIKEEQPEKNCFSNNNIGYYYLPKRVINLIIEKNKSKSKEYYTFKSTLNTIPDIDEKYYLNYIPLITSDDNIKVEFTPEGFIKSVNSETEDKTTQVAIKLIDITSSIKKITDNTPTPKSESEVVDKEIIYNETFDPLIIDNITNINSKLADYKFTIKITDANGNEFKNVKTNKITEKRGLLYKDLKPYHFIIEKDISNNNKYSPISDEIIYLPSDILTLDIHRDFGVKKISNLNFDNGILKDISISKPSEVISFLETPINILKALISIPTDLIQLKIDISNKNKGLTDAQKAEIEAKDALIKYLDDEKKKSENQNNNNPLK